MRSAVLFSQKIRIALFLLVLSQFTFPQASLSQTINAIRVGDYSNYTHVCLELSKKASRVIVAPNPSNSTLQIKIGGGSSGSLGTSFTPPVQQQTAFSSIRFSNDSSGYLVLTIPVSDYVDLSSVQWHSWSDMLTIDLPYIVPVHPNTPTQAELRTFIDSGGKVVVIDAGHGGLDPGAVGGYAIKERPRLKEKDVALDIALRLKNVLDQDTNFLPILTRNGDYLPVPMGLKGTTRSQYLSASLEHRVKIAQTYYGSVMLSLHLNAPGPRTPHSRPRGYEIYYQGHTTAQSLLDRIGHYDSDQLELIGIERGGEQSDIVNIINGDNVVKHSLLLATALTDEITSVPGVVKRPKPILSARFRVLKHLNMPTALLEYGFITHPSDHRFVASASNRQKLAEATYQGIRNYFFPGEVGSGREFDYAQLVEMSKNEPKASPTVNPNPVYHTVRRGDSLGKIAQRYGVSIRSIRSNNRGKIGRRDTIVVGQKLLISGARTPSPSAPPSSPGQLITYTVRSGDTLGKIALRYKTSVTSLRALNNLRGSTIYRGQKIKVMPGNSGSNFAAATRQIHHTVKRGDTLYDLAVKYGTTTRTIMNSNNLRSSAIKPGQTLTILTR